MGKREIRGIDVKIHQAKKEMQETFTKDIGLRLYYYALFELNAEHMTELSYDQKSTLLIRLRRFIQDAKEYLEDQESQAQKLGIFL